MRSRILLLVVLILAAVSCARMPKKEAVVEHRYALEGAIVSLDAAAHTATIKHGDLADTTSGEVWMKGMTMEFPVQDQAEFAKLQQGQKIRATVHRKDLEFWLGEIKVEPIAGKE